MDSSKRKLTKYSCIYRCPDDIADFKIRIRIKEIPKEGIVNDGHWTNKIFEWQKKSFSVFEKEFYKDIINCVTDLEKKYHDIVTDEENDDDGFIFCYTNEDILLFNREEKSYNYLDEMMKNMTMEENNIKTEEYDFKTSVINSIENPVLYRKFEQMKIVIDLGEYFENTWIKNEKILCSLKYEKNKHILQIYPDFTTTEPYILESDGEVVKKYQYFIENCSSGNNLQETDLVRKINEYKGTIQKQLIGSNFEMPEKNKLQVFLFFEILTARCFEYPNVYIEYFIDLPQHWIAKSSIQGRTQICRTNLEDGHLNFGYGFDVVLEYNIQGFQGKEFSKSPVVYFEMISKDSWDRYRTEGLSYKILPIFKPGIFNFELNCFRFSSYSFSDNLRRFFIGDCKNYDDVTWIGIPKENQKSILNKFGTTTATTGQLNIRVNVIHQSNAFLDEFNEDPSKLKQKLILDRLSSSTLIKTVEEVLRAFKKARKNMLEAKIDV